MAYVSVDVDMDDIYYELSRRERQELAEMLAGDGHCILIKQEQDAVGIGPDNALDELWKEQVSKLFTARLHLTQEQEQAILEITKNL